MSGKLCIQLSRTATVSVQCGSNARCLLRTADGVNDLAGGNDPAPLFGAGEIGDDIYPLREYFTRGNLTYEYLVLDELFCYTRKVDVSNTRNKKKL